MCQASALGRWVFEFTGAVNQEPLGVEFVSDITKESGHFFLCQRLDQSGKLLAGIEGHVAVGKIPPV